MFTIIWLNTSTQVTGAWVCQNEEVHKACLKELQSQPWMKIISSEPSLYCQKAFAFTSCPVISSIAVRNINV